MRFYKSCLHFLQEWLTLFTIDRICGVFLQQPFAVYQASCNSSFFDPLVGRDCLSLSNFDLRPDYYRLKFRMFTSTMWETAALSKLYQCIVVLFTRYWGLMTLEFSSSLYFRTFQITGSALTTSDHASTAAGAFIKPIHTEFYYFYEECAF